jgi:HEAT repeat protein
MQSGTGPARDKAVSILARIGLPAKPAVPALQKAMNDPDEEVRARAVTLLRQLEPAAITASTGP